MRRFIARLMHVLRSDRAEDDLAREMTSHLAMLEAEYQRRGMSPDDARLAARRAMGSVALAKDLHRDARSFLWLEDFVTDLRYACRGLWRAPGFAAAVVLTLALGIGANTAIFSVVNAVLVRPLPYPDADRLIYLLEEFPPADGTGTPDRRAAMDVQTVAEFRRHTRTLSAVGVQESRTATMVHGGATFRLSGSKVSPAFLSMLGAQPLRGRVFEARDEAAGNDAVVLLSHAAWQRYFAEAPDVIGQPVRLDDRGYTVVGVLPREFPFHPNPQAEFWIPFVLPESGFLMVPVLARLQDGVSRDAALAEITAILRRLRGRPAGTPPADPTFSIVRLQDQMVAPVKPALLVLTFSVGFVLIIACVNVANLLLARMLVRGREVAIRAALGAGAGRIVRLFFAESFLLAAAGGLVGTVLASWGVRLFRVLGTSLPRRDVSAGVSIPRLDEIAIDPSTLAFAIAVSALTGLIFGVIPVIRRGRGDAVDSLRSRAGAAPLAGSPLHHHRIRDLLVVAEVAMAMTLLVGAALMMTSFVRLVLVDPGYDPTGVVTFQATLPEGRDMANFAEDLVARLQSIDGVRAAGYATDIPMTRSRGHFPLRMTPSRERPAPGERTADPNYVSRDFIKAMGIDIVEGRGFEERDRLGSPQVLLVNRTLARSGMVGSAPLGAQVYALFRNPWEIVGIVEDMRPEGLDQEPYSQFFINLSQTPGFPFNEFRPYFAVRTGGDTGALVANLRDVVRQVEARATVDNVATLDQIVRNSVSRPRLYAVLLGLFATVAVLLAVTGIFGLMAYLVEHRTREIGIRMALGAQRLRVISGMLGRSGLLVLAGVAVGLMGAAGLTRYLEGMLFGLTPLDPATFAAASLLFVVVALAASYIPARRATRVDPVVALGSE